MPCGGQVLVVPEADASAILAAFDGCAGTLAAIGTPYGMDRIEVAALVSASGRDPYRYAVEDLDREDARLRAWEQRHAAELVTGYRV